MDAIEFGFEGVLNSHKAVTRNLDRAANISDWVRPYLQKMVNISQFRQFKLEMVERQVTVMARTRCAEDAEFNPWLNLTMETGFSKVTLPHLLILTLLQVFKSEAPKAVDLCNVPDAQQPNRNKSDVEKTKHVEWKNKVIDGVTKIIKGRRGKFMSYNVQIDLCKCLNLLDGANTLPFDWEISMYTNPPALKPPRLPTDKMGVMLGDKTYKDFQEPDIDDDNNDMDAIERPTWNLGEVHIARIPLPPYWAMVRLKFYTIIDLIRYNHIF